MLIIAHHYISDPESFWSAAKEVANNVPGNLQLHGVYPAMDGKTGTCLWEAEHVEEVQQFLDEHAGQFAKNFCYAVDVEKSMGLPKFQMAEVHL
jgi:hypothetical protein